MKNMIVFLTLALGFAQPTLAHEGGEFGQFNCTQNPTFSPIQGGVFHYVVVQQFANTRNYSLQVYRKPANGYAQLIGQDIAIVTTEDVMANFRGPRMSLSVFLDELDQTTLYWGNTRLTLTCAINR